MSQEMFGSRGRGRGGGGGRGRGGGDRGGSRGFRGGGGGRGFRGGSRGGSFRGGDRGGRGGDRGGRGNRGGPFGGGHGRGGPAFGNRGRGGQMSGARGRGGAVLPSRGEYQRYEIKAGLQLYVTFNEVPNYEELAKLPGFHSVNTPYSKTEILRTILFRDLESLEAARKILDAHENVKSTDQMGMKSSKKQSDSLESRQVYLRFVKPYVEDVVKQLDSKIEEIVPLKENSCKVQFATAEEAAAAIERLKGHIGENFLKYVDVPYVVQSAKLAAANIQQDQVVLRDVSKEVTIKEVADVFPDAISFTLYNKTFPASKFCHAALRFKTNERAAEVLAMTDLKIGGKKVYTYPCCMEFLHEYPKLGEPELVHEEEENGAQVKEEPPNKKRKVEGKKEVGEDADGEEEEESGEEEEDDEDDNDDDEDEDQEEEENDEADDDDSDESD